MLSTIVIAMVAAIIAAAIAYYLYKPRNKQVAAGVVILIIIFFILRFYVFPYHANHYQATATNSYPIYAVIEKYYPDEYEQYTDYLKTNVKEDSSTRYDDEVKASGAIVNYALEQGLPYASTEAVYNLLNTTIKFYEFLYEKDPDYIIMMEFPGRVGVKDSYAELSTAIPEESVVEIMSAKQAIIESGSLNKAKGVEPVQMTPEMNKTVDAIFDQLVKQYGKEVIENTFVDVSLPVKDPKASAQAIITLYQSVAALNPVDAANILKALYAEAAPQN